MRPGRCVHRYSLSVCEPDFFRVWGGMGVGSVCIRSLSVFYLGRG